MNTTIQYRILIEDRNYATWKFINPDTNNIIDIELEENRLLKNVDPLQLRMFTRDIFLFDENGKVNIIDPQIKMLDYISGVLILENNKTFGRTKNKKRLLYKCIPDDRTLPIFLIPYEVKLGFSKAVKNKYVIFKFDSWTEKHPQGILIETLGNVDKLDAFYEYQLYCKNQHVSMTELMNIARYKYKEKLHSEYIQEIYENPNFKIQDKRNEYVFTIDPNGCKDFDDGYSITQLESGDWKVTIYIANVYVWIETLGLWNSLSKRVATIYLPDRRRPMLPTILSENLCSLQADEERFALSMDIYVSKTGKVDESKTCFYNSIIKVKKNFVYEEPTMVNKSIVYLQLYEISKKMDDSIKNSHDVVAHWMILMNTITSEVMIKKKYGIFRSVSKINEDKGNGLPLLDEETNRVISLWNNTIGQYISYKKDISINHDVMNKKSYIHITSPIRRMVDLLNQMLLFSNESFIESLSNDALLFLTKWMNQLDYVNISMRSIRKIQLDSALMDRCFNDPEVMNKLYKGTIIDAVLNTDGSRNYMVYLHELKMLSRISYSLIVMDNYNQYEFRIYLFENEEKTTKKIKVMPIL